MTHRAHIGVGRGRCPHHYKGGVSKAAKCAASVGSVAIVKAASKISSAPIAAKCIIGALVIGVIVKLFRSGK